MGNGDSQPKSVTATVELTGTYEEIISIIGESEHKQEEFSPILDDIAEIIHVVVRTDGATKSRIVEELPETTSVDFDSNDVIHVLRVLELYDIVELDGNTWRPGDIDLER